MHRGNIPLQQWYIQFSGGAWPVNTVIVFLQSVQLCTNVFLFHFVFPRTYSVFFTDVVQLKAPGMGPDSAEHLEILEEFGPSAAPAPLHSIAHTCRPRKEFVEEDGCVFVLWSQRCALRLFTQTELVQQKRRGTGDLFHMSVRGRSPKKTTGKGNPFWKTKLKEDWINFQSVAFKAD